MSALVSVIIPVYNLESYIGNCLEKMICQTYKNIEIICIDDGSTDSTAQIIKKFAANDSRIVYIYQENAGVSAARNKGLDAAKGDYIMFVDGDDYLHYQAIEIYVKCIIESGCDIVCSEHIKTNHLSCDDLPIENQELIELDNSNDLFGLSSCNFRSVCGKLFAHHIVCDFSFPLEIFNGEDTIFLFKVLSNNPKIAYVDASLYYYFNRNDSITNNGFHLSFFSVVDGLGDLCDFLKTKKLQTLLTQAIVLLFKAIISNKTLSYGTEFESFVFKKCKSIGNKWIKDLYITKNISSKKKFSLIAFYYSRHLYELARLLQDPTMKDFYKNRRKNKKMNRKG